MLLNAFISLLFATAYAHTPNPQEYLMLYAPNPILIEIARCESGFRQFNADGTVLHGPLNKDGIYDYGLFQIHGSHIKEATNMGFDVMTESGNIGFALHLYRTEGTRPWISSSKCWGSPAP